MKIGYRTDKNGNVLDYFELPEIPLNTEDFLWVESDSKPPIYIPPLTIQQQINKLESSITERMKQEALAGSTNVFPNGTYAGKTALQVIAIIRGQIDTLRAQL